MWPLQGHMITCALWISYLAVPAPFPTRHFWKREFPRSSIISWISPARCNPGMIPPLRWRKSTPRSSRNSLLWFPQQLLSQSWQIVARFAFGTVGTANLFRWRTRRWRCHGCHDCRRRFGALDFLSSRHKEQLLSLRSPGQRSTSFIIQVQTCMHCSKVNIFRLRFQIKPVRSRCVGGF